jgi:hypothetical protein
MSISYRISDETERWVFFWVCFGARLSQAAFLVIIPGSANLIPD